MSQLDEFLKRGQAAQLAANIERMVALLYEGDNVRDVYRTRRGTYAITYGGGEVTAATVEQALATGRIAETYPGEGIESYRLPELVNPVPRRKEHNHKS